MKPIKHWLVTVLALGVTASAASIPAQAEFLVQGVQVLDTDANVYLTLDANLLNTLEGTTTASYNALVTAILAANNKAIADTPDYFDGDSKKYTVAAADFQTGGFATYWGAIAFVNYLNSIKYGGSNKWTLPDVGTDTNLGYNQTGNLFGALYYNAGGTPGTPPANISPFINVVSAYNDSGYYPAYWFGTSYAPDANYAWTFCSAFGFQWFNRKDFFVSVWPVRPGPAQNL